MSEIKGQILGVILVLMIFAVVATTMTGVFSSLSHTVTEKVNDMESAMPTSLTYFEDLTLTKK